MQVYVFLTIYRNWQFLRAGTSQGAQGREGGGCREDASNRKQVGPVRAGKKLEGQQSREAPPKRRYFMIMLQAHDSALCCQQLTNAHNKVKEVHVAFPVYNVSSTVKLRQDDSRTHKHGPNFLPIPQSTSMYWVTLETAWWPAIDTDNEVAIVRGEISWTAIRRDDATFSMIP